MNLLRFSWLAPLAALLILAGALPWYEQLNLHKVVTGQDLSAFFYRLPFMDKPQAAMAYRWLHGVEIDDELIETQIERALVARPLFADNWLLAARVKYRLGKLDEAARMAERAQQLGPTRGYLLWDLAIFWLAYPDKDRAISLLHDYLRAIPRDVEKVILLAYRLEADKSALLAKLIPAQSAPGYDEDFYAARLLRVALKLKNPEMARLAWTRFTQRAAADNPNASTLKAYLDFLIAQGDKGAALGLWRALYPERGEISGVFNASFEKALLGHGFGWKTTQGKGVQIERSFDQSMGGDYSLKISLDGSQNVNLYRPGITIPVEGARHYRLTVYWKGERLTTRSSPFFQIAYKVDGKYKSVRSEPRRGSWNWTRVQMDFEVPYGVEFIEFSLRRWKTQALDKLISGTLYIDDLKLQELD